MPESSCWSSRHTCSSPPLSRISKLADTVTLELTDCQVPRAYTWEESLSQRRYWCPPPPPQPSLCPGSQPDCRLLLGHHFYPFKGVGDRTFFPVALHFLCLWCGGLNSPQSPTMLLSCQFVHGLDDPCNKPLTSNNASHYHIQDLPTMWSPEPGLPARDGVPSPPAPSPCVCSLSTLHPWKDQETDLLSAGGG